MKRLQQQHRSPADPFYHFLVKGNAQFYRLFAATRFYIFITRLGFACSVWLVKTERGISTPEETNFFPPSATHQPLLCYRSHQRVLLGSGIQVMIQVTDQKVKSLNSLYFLNLTLKDVHIPLLILINPSWRAEERIS